MARVYIPVQGTEKEVRVALDHLPHDASDILDILKAEQTPLHLWLIIAREYFKQGKIEQFRQILEEGFGPGEWQAMNELVCHTAANPFHVKLTGPKRRPEMEARFTRKRVNSPQHSCGEDGEPSMVQQKSHTKQPHKNGKLSVKAAVRLTPDGKRRRRLAQLLQPFNLESSGCK